MPPADPVATFAEDALNKADGWVRTLASARMKAHFGPTVVEIVSCGATMDELALGGLRHAACAEDIEADFRIVAIDSQDTDIASAPVWSFPPTGDRAHMCRQQFDGGRLDVGLNLEWRTWGIFDRQRKLALIWSHDAARTPEWVIRDQTRNALHWWSQFRRWGLFHAAALRLGDRGCLIAGKSGSGKSTVTAAALLAGFSTAGDDFVLVETNGLAPRVHAVFHTIKIDDASLDRLPQLKSSASKPIPLPNEKFLVRLFEAAPDRVATDFPVHAVLHSRVAGTSKSRIARSHSSRVFSALAPSTVLLLRTQENEIVAKSAELARSLPAYSFDIGVDINEAVETLRSFMAELSP
jgi:hypothetical protein